MEKWADIEGYEGIYQISNKGRIKSLSRKIRYGKGFSVSKEKIRKPAQDRNGYYVVILRKNGSVKRMYIHRLVANAFLDKVEGKGIINHKDGKPKNNEVENLEWCNYKENLIHAFKNKLNKNPIEIKVTDKINGKEETFYSMAEASRFMGKTNSYVSTLLKRGKSENEQYKFGKVEDNHVKSY